MDAKFHLLFNFKESGCMNYTSLFSVFSLFLWFILFFLIFLFYFLTLQYCIGFNDTISNSFKTIEIYLNKHHSIFVIVFSPNS